RPVTPLADRANAPINRIGRAGSRYTEALRHPKVGVRSERITSAPSRSSLGGKTRLIRPFDLIALRHLARRRRRLGRPRKNHPRWNRTALLGQSRDRRCEVYWRGAFPFRTDNVLAPPAPSLPADVPEHTAPDDSPAVLKHR